MIVVVSDTSPIRALAHIQHLSLLPQLFDRVLVPPAVERELARPADPQRVVEVKSHAFLELQQPKNFQFFVSEDLRKEILRQVGE